MLNMLTIWLYQKAASDSTVSVCFSCGLRQTGLQARWLHFSVRFEVHSSNGI